MKYLLRYIVYCVVAIAFSAAQAGSYEDFFRAVNTDNPRVVAELLARGFDPNTPDARGNTGLMLAIRDGSPKVAEQLLAAPGVRIDATNAADETALMLAALRGQTEMMRALIERGAAVNRPGWTPLHYAASSSEPAAVGLLLDRGADIEAPSPNHTTPLMMAARYGALDAADLLLRRGARAAARNDAGLDAADFAKAAARDELAARLTRAAR